MSNTKEDLTVARLGLLEAQHDLTITKGLMAEVELAVGKQRFEWAKASDIDNRIFRFDTDVNSKSCYACNDFVSRCFRIAPSELVEIRLTTGGGDVWSGMALIDDLVAMRGEGLRLRITARGTVASMGIYIMQAASLGERVGGPSTTYMIHKIQISGGEGGGLSGSLDQIEDATAWAKLMQKRSNALLVERSDMTERQITAGLNRKDWSMDSYEALSLGIIDRIG